MYMCIFRAMVCRLAILLLMCILYRPGCFANHYELSGDDWKHKNEGDDDVQLQQHDEIPLHSKQQDVVGDVGEEKLDPTIVYATNRGIKNSQLLLPQKGSPAQVRRRKIDFRYVGDAPAVSNARSSKVVFHNEYLLARHKRDLSRKARSDWSSWASDWTDWSPSDWSAWSSTDWANWANWASDWTAWNDWASDWTSDWNDWNSWNSWNGWSDWDTWTSSSADSAVGLVVGVSVAVAVSLLVIVVCIICCVVYKYRQNTNVRNNTPDRFRPSRVPYTAGQTVNNSLNVATTNFGPSGGYGAPVPPTSYNYPGGPQPTNQTYWSPPESQTSHNPVQLPYPPVGASAPADPSAPSESAAPPPNYYLAVNDGRYAVPDEPADAQEAKNSSADNNLELPTYNEYLQTSSDRRNSSSSSSQTSARPSNE